MEFFRRKPKKEFNLTIRQVLDLAGRRDARGIDEDETYIISMSFRRARKKLNLTISEMASRSGENEELIIDLENNGFGLQEAVEISNRLRDVYGIDKKTYNKILLLQSTDNKI